MADTPAAPATAGAACPPWCVRHSTRDGAHRSAPVEIPPHGIEGGAFPARIELEQLPDEDAPAVSVTAEVLLTLEQAAWLAAEICALVGRGKAMTR